MSGFGEYNFSVSQLFNKQLTNRYSVNSHWIDDQFNDTKIELSLASVAA